MEAITLRGWTGLLGRMTPIGWISAALVLLACLGAVMDFWPAVLGQAHFTVLVNP